MSTCEIKARLQTTRFWFGKFWSRLKLDLFQLKYLCFLFLWLIPPLLLCLQFLFNLRVGGATADLAS